MLMLNGIPTGAAGAGTTTVTDGGTPLGFGGRPITPPIDGVRASAGSCWRIWLTVPVDLSPSPVGFISSSVRRGGCLMCGRPVADLDQVRIGIVARLVGDNQRLDAFLEAESLSCSRGCGEAGDDLSIRPAIGGHRDAPDRDRVQGARGAGRAKSCASHPEVNATPEHGQP